MSAATHATYFRFDTVEEGLVALQEQREKTETLHRGRIEAFDAMKEATRWHEFMRGAADQSQDDERSIHHAIEQTVKRIASEAVSAGFHSTRNEP